MNATMTATSEQDQTRKFTDKSAAMANEAVDKGKVATERSARAIEQSYSATAANMRDYNLKMIDMTKANIKSVFDFASQLATARTPSDIVELWSTHARKQFEMFGEQTKELTALGQKLAVESSGPIERSINQTFRKAS